MLKRFTKKIVSPEVGIIPIVADTLESLQPLMVDPEIDYQKAFVNNFTPLHERRKFQGAVPGNEGTGYRYYSLQIEGPYGPVRQTWQIP